VRDRNVELGCPSDDDARRLDEKLLARFGAHDDDQAVGLGGSGARSRRSGSGGRVAPADGILVVEDEPVVTHLNDVTLCDRVVADVAASGDVRAVVTRAVADDPPRTVASQKSMFAGNVAFGETDRVFLASTDRVLVAHQWKRRTLPLVILDG